MVPINFFLETAAFSVDRESHTATVYSNHLRRGPNERFVTGSRLLRVQTGDFGVSLGNDVLRASTLINFLPDDHITIETGFNGGYTIELFEPPAITLDQAILFGATTVPEPSAALGLGAGIAMLAALSATK